MQLTSKSRGRERSVAGKRGRRSVNWGGGNDRSVNWGGGGKRVLLASVLCVFVVVVAAFSGGAARTDNVHPALTALARHAPQETARVIVQHGAGAAAVAAAVEKAGGTVLKELSIIDATVAELPAAAVTDVAQLDEVRWVSPDGPVANTGRPPKNLDPSTLPANNYLDTLGVRQVWAMGITGEGIGVAVIDSGVFPDRDFTTEPGRPFTRLVANVNFNGDSAKTDDNYGHGTHVAGIVGGNGYASDGIYSGIAPHANLINLKIMDDNGMAYESDTVAAMQWVLDNKETYNIRVVNLSVQSGAESSYHTSPLDAAAEILWFNRIVVVAAAGNWADDGSNPIHAAPANDPFVITVGASDENGTAVRSDDTVAPFSAFGETHDAAVKPELLAPGMDIVSVLSHQSTWSIRYPDRVVLDGEYFRLSGTSMAAPMVTGAVALLLQDEPDLTPDQVKYRLLSTASSAGGASGYLDVYAAVTGNTTEAANTGVAASQLLWSGNDPAQWDSVNWGSVNWGSVNWGSVNWGSVNWGSVNWGAVNWGN